MAVRPGAARWWLHVRRRGTELDRQEIGEMVFPEAPPPTQSASILRSLTRKHHWLRVVPRTGHTEEAQALPIVPHSNRVSSNQSLRFRETEFSSQRQGGREGSEALRTALQRQNLLQQPPPIRAYSPRTGKSPLERKCVVGLRVVALVR
jgi:hypothetical protein